MVNILSLSIFIFIGLSSYAQSYEKFKLKLQDIRLDIPPKQVVQYKQILDSIIKTDTPDSALALVYHRLGWAYNENNDYPLALLYTQKGYNLRTKIFPSYHSDIANSAYNLGLIYQVGLDYGLSNKFLNKALPVYKKSNNPLVIDCLIAIANNLQHIGDYEKSALYAQEAILASTNEISKANSLATKGIAFEQLKNYTGAVQNYLEAYQILKKHKSDDITISENYSACCVNLANLYTKINRFDEAIKYHREAINNSFSLGNSSAVAFAYNDLAYTYLKSGKLIESTDCVKKGLAICPKTDTNTLSYLYNSLGKIYLNKGNFDLANQNFIKAIKYHTRQFILEQNRHSFILKESHFSNAVLYFIENLGQSTLQSNQLGMANQVYTIADTLIDLMRQEHSEEKSKLFWREKTRDIYVNAIELCFRTGNIDKAFYFMEKSRAILLLDALRNINAQNVLSPQLQNQELELKQKIYVLEQKLSSITSDSKKHGVVMNQLIEAKEQYQNFIKNLSKTNPEYHRLKYATDVISLKDLKSYLSKNQQSYVGYFTTDSVVYAMSVTAQKTILKKIAFPNYKKTIEQFLSGILTQRVGFNQGQDELAFKIYETIIKPLQVPKGQLIVSLDGIFFPVEALISKSNDSKSFLLNDYAINYAYSANTLLQPQTQKFLYKTMLGVAPVTFQKSLRLPALVGSDKVLDDIPYHNFTSQNLTLRQATKRNFLDKASDYQIVQLFTHGKANNGDLGPTIYLADSALYLTELYQQQPLKADLVVLSACETGLGELQTGEGVMSMARGFSYMGVPSTITTLWSVSSNETYKLTTYFYEFLNKGLPKNIALQKAKLKLINENPLPYYWSSMVLIGDNAPISNHFWIWVIGSICLGLIVLILIFRFRRQRIVV